MAQKAYDKWLNRKSDRTKLLKDEFDVLEIYKRIKEDIGKEYEQKFLEQRAVYDTQLLSFANEREEIRKTLLEEQIRHRREVKDFIDQIAEERKQKSELQQKIFEYEDQIKDLKERIYALEKQNPH
ncbi:MAG TPA: hypothetical protein VD794_05430 [Flavisolibacter sp.]|nr:hypothetical protein [Flavisolibacter sp.]